MMPDNELSREYTILKIIWFAIFFSLAVYLVVGLLVGGKGQPMDAQAYAMLRIALFALACILFFTARLVKKGLLNTKTRVRQRAGLLQQPEVQRYCTAMIVACAMSEAIGIFGLVLYILGKDVTDLYVLIAIAAIVVLQHRPKEEELKSLFQQAGPGGMPVM